jgi:hypothetical protein
MAPLPVDPGEKSFYFFLAYSLDVVIIFFLRQGIPGWLSTCYVAYSVLELSILLP